jgi:heme a synthase
MFATRFSKYAWFVVLYVIGVIVWGAVVRATGSGAGCGNHWPTCNGEILPNMAEIGTRVEFIHRVTSGVSGLLVIGLLIWAFRRQSSVFTRRMAVLSFVFILIEGALGAALVRLELVEDNASTLRAVMIALHLLNTLVLLTWLVLTAWSGARGEVVLNPLPDRWRARVYWLLGIAIVGTMVMSAAGAVTALGDTLFLSGALENANPGADPKEHFLVQLRVIHPVIAVGVSLFLFMVGNSFIQATQKDSVRRLVYLLYGVIALQLFVGVVNIAFLAPVAVQMLHLFLADVMWLTLVLLTAEILLTVKELPPVMEKAQALRVAA